MSGFSASWLALREPADHRARDPALAVRLTRHFARHETLRIIDLGCGAGSNLRALAPALKARQIWRLIDYDQALLDEAARQISAWKDSEQRPDITAKFEKADLNRQLEDVVSQEADLITAAALFDLVSEPWIERFVACLAKQGCAFYTVLIYDGAMRWLPTHPADEAVCAAFNAHQQQDKGFGPAAGPDAGRFLAERLRSAGYDVTAASSPWCLGPEDRELIMAVSDGIGRAAAETGRLSRDEIASWTASRQQIVSCDIGHVDLLALPRA